MNSPNTPLTAEEVTRRYGLSAATLLRWMRLHRIHPVRVKLGAGEVGSDLRFLAGDIAAAVEASSFEPGSRGHDASMG